MDFNSIIRRCICLVVVLLSCITFLQAQDWSNINHRTIPSIGQRDIVPRQYVTFQVDEQEIKNILWQAPGESSTHIRSSDVLLKVGLADGSVDTFRMVSYKMMEDELANSYPDIKTFKGVSISNPFRIIRADWTANGLRALIRDENGMTYIDPFQRNDLNHRIAYFKKDILPQGDWSCGVESEKSNPSDHYSRLTGDCTLRSYRLAQATTAEYSNYFGATSSAQSAIVMAEVVTAINRINEVYEADVSVRLILVSNTNLLFYYTPSSDPYSNGNGSAMLGQNQTTCDNIIGNSNYDIGHVFSTGGGGVAYLQAVCNNSIKAGGVTGQAAPVGDPFYIDYVAHEMGHQFGGNHTQNNNCNRHASTAMEPGSASTIMGYAGICAPNVQNNSDAYFHGINLQEIGDHVVATNCDVVVSTANAPPVVDNILNYTIPKSTPFVLTASASDPNGDPLTYCWEQWDHEVGPMPPASTNTLGPMFRSLLPSTSPSRYFYNLTDLTNNVNPTWEELPSVARTMEFKVTVRDFYNGIYGCTDEDNTIITTDVTSGPFTVTSHNSGATWQEGSLQTITWDVAGTTASPVSCANVDIRFSSDGGFTYPVALLLNTPNDGSAAVTVPTGLTTDARIMVKASNNVFFDINNQDIIVETGVPNFTISLNPSSVTECNDGSVQTSVIVGSVLGFVNPVTLSLINPPAGAVITFVPAVVIPGNTSTLTISNIGALSGTYTPIVRGTSTTGIKDANFTINLTLPTTDPDLDEPLNHALNIDLRPSLLWTSVPGATTYDYQVSLNNSFAPLTFSGVVNTNQILVPSLLNDQTNYYWRVRANNICGAGPWSAVYDFKTMVCENYSSTNVPVAIPSGGTPVVISTLSLAIDEVIQDINIINLGGTHTFMDNLRFSLISPVNTQVVVWDRPCDGQDNFNIHFDDEAANSNWPCPPTDGLQYRGSNLFNAFNGQSTSGLWTLKVEDLASQNGGNLNSWGLRVCWNECLLVVTETTGSGPGSLRAAVDCAHQNDTITISPALSGMTINIGSTPLVLTKNVSIESAASNVTIMGSGVRAFEIPSGVSTSFEDLTITAGTSLAGGAILNYGSIILRDVTIEKNPAISGATLLNNIGGGMRLEGLCYINQ